jgi:hypothetical protein
MREGGREGKRNEDRADKQEDRKWMERKLQNSYV